MSRNVLIRNLTAEQSRRLALLRERFGVKTNSQALLLLLQHGVTLDDELSTLASLYRQLGRACATVMEEAEKSGLSSPNVEHIISQLFARVQQLERLLSVRGGRRKRRGKLPPDEAGGYSQETPTGF
jgi:hypothetical protein